MTVRFSAGIHWDTVTVASVKICPLATGGDLAVSLQNICAKKAVAFQMRNCVVTQLLFVGMYRIICILFVFIMLRLILLAEIECPLPSCTVQLNPNTSAAKDVQGDENCEVSLHTRQNDTLEYGAKYCLLTVNIFITGKQVVLTLSCLIYVTLHYCLMRAGSIYVSILVQIRNVLWKKTLFGPSCCT